MKSNPVKILLVEDDELFRLGLSTRIQQETDLIVTAEAEDGETAVQLVNQQPFDLVLLDVGLPGIPGVEACRQIKSCQPNLPVLVLTSHSQKSLIVKLIEAKAQGYCLKGIAIGISDYGYSLRRYGCFLVGCNSNPRNSVCIYVNGFKFSR